MQVIKRHHVQDSNHCPRGTATKQNNRIVRVSNHQPTDYKGNKKIGICRVRTTDHMSTSGIANHVRHKGDEMFVM